MSTLSFADAKRGRLSIGNHEDLALFLRSKNVIQTDSVFEAFALTDRGYYAGNQKRLEQMKTKTGEEAVTTSTYWDRPLGIGNGAMPVIDLSLIFWLAVSYDFV